MSDKVRLASIGLGRWAHVLAAAQRGDIIELYSCFSRSEEQRSVFQKAFDVRRAATTLDELLDDQDVEGVIITTPNDTLCLLTASPVRVPRSRRFWWAD